MFKQWNQWALLLLRLVFGIGLMQAGFPKLFLAAGRVNIAHLLESLGLPWPQVMGWVVGLIEFVGGFGILIGALIAIAAGLNAISITTLLILSSVRGGMPEPLPGGDPFPDYRLAILILAGMLTLIMGGAGAYSIDHKLAIRRNDSSLQSRLENQALRTTN
jgi:putative oxidoreductase